MVDPQSRSSVERANLPLTRAELDRAHAGLLNTTLAPCRIMRCQAAALAGTVASGAPIVAVDMA